VKADRETALSVTRAQGKGQTAVQEVKSNMRESRQENDWTQQ